ncbi:MAG: 2-amino-4-hydroxy-6-hydroxymethyldihydropteridine diphosphokinase [Dehalococcoidia bacterium]|nr:2-amino-4-hydroxy-6-hydroxymethyldihydropteridine diphosphokinase [Dehalococcoidia bacterium]
MVEVLLGLGTNLGDREGNLLEALRRLGASVLFKAVSSLYETDPVGYLDQPTFVNAVCLGETSLSPEELLGLVKSIEAQMGRKPTFRDGPRLIDIDILSYGSQVIDTAELTIPHLRMAERAFVLVPLAEIAPKWRHPVLRKTAAELAAAVGHDGVRLLVGARS